MAVYKLVTYVVNNSNSLFKYVQLVVNTILVRFCD